MKILKIIYYLFLGCLTVIALFLIISVIPITGNFKTMAVLSDQWSRRSKQEHCNSKTNF